MKKRALFFFLLVLVTFLAACAPQTEDEQIAGINEMIAPDGYLTKTHLYIRWPAVYTEPRPRFKIPGGVEIVPAITLKIPLEYLGQNVVSFENAAKIERHDAGQKEAETPAKIDYWSRITGALFKQKGFITFVYIRLLPGAKPYVPMLPFKTDPPEIAFKKAEHFLTSYAVHIKRNQYFVLPLAERRPDRSVYYKSPAVSCRDDSCYVSFGVKGRQTLISGAGEGLDHPNLARFNRENKIPPVTPPDGLPKWRVKVDPTQILLNS